MRAVAHTQPLPVDDPLALINMELPEPVVAAGELLIEIEAVGVNPIDAKLRQRTPDPAEGPRPIVLGFDAAGRVLACGSDQLGFHVGDRVWYAGCVGRQGCNAERQSVNHRWVSRRPERLTPAAAAAMPLCGLTAWEALFERLGISVAGDDAGKSILIIGAAGGVGSLAIQLARVQAGLDVTATASRPESRSWCEGLGADRVLDHAGDLVQAAGRAGRSAFDYILCCAEPSRWFAPMAELIAPQGGICALVDSDAPLPMNALKRKSVRFVWEFMFTRPLFGTLDQGMHHSILNRLAEAVDAGRLVSPLTRHLGPLSAENLRLAHRSLESGRTIGKLALDAWLD
jgi:NADPH:quinone reductase